MALNRVTYLRYFYCNINDVLDVLFVAIATLYYYYYNYNIITV